MPSKDSSSASSSTSGSGTRTRRLMKPKRPSLADAGTSEFPVSCPRAPLFAFSATSTTSTDPTTTTTTHHHASTGVSGSNSPSPLRSRPSSSTTNPRNQTRVSGRRRRSRFQQRSSPPACSCAPRSLLMTARLGPTRSSTWMGHTLETSSPMAATFSACPGTALQGKSSLSAVTRWILLWTSTTTIRPTFPSCWWPSRSPRSSSSSTISSS
mmetsp:Transcript_13638/g.39741  ORF Transcript_13638/g.39741 Transcript_13638/m.39741 type:complete len:211 (-) Transcript_13638:1027-1659(-)